MSKQAKQNEPLVTHIYTADPSAHVFEGKIYIYPSHDLEHDGQSDDDGSQYRMEDYHVFSMDDIDAPVVDHGEVLHMKNVPWVSQQMWAPDAAYKNGKYYLFFPAKDKEGIFRIGVATSDKPAGPFTPEPNYIPGSYSIDPAIFVDDDGKAYLYFGGIWGGQLEKWQTGTFNPNAGPQDPKEIAIGPRVAVMNDDMLSFAEPPQEIQILDENGNPSYTYTINDTLSKGLTYAGDSQVTVKVVAEVQQILAADAAEGRPQYVCPEQVAWSEITAALRWSPVTGESRILEAEALTSTWRPLLDAMLAGTVTIEHMRAIGRQLRHLPGRASGAARPPSATTGCF